MVSKSIFKNISKKTKKLTLSNGLKVVLFESKRAPIIFLNISFHVGSKDEKEGERGYAHLLEHLLFQGSLNTQEDYFKSLEKYGARLNGGTTEDRTIYWANLPKEIINYALFVESDRFKNLFPFVNERRLQNQIDVVKNEKRQRIENEPYGIADEVIPEVIFPEGHPYRHPVIGYFEDLENATLTKIKAFFDKYYCARNCSITICGDFEEKEILENLEKNFSNLKDGKYYPPFEKNVPEIKSTKNFEVESNVKLKRIYYLWPTPSFFDDDDKAIFIVSKYLTSGKDSPLFKKLIIENRLCESVEAVLYSGEVCGLFSIIVTLNDDKNEMEAEKIIFNELNKLSKEGIKDDDFNYTITTIEAIKLRKLQKLGGFYGLADFLNFYNLYFDNPLYLEEDFEKLLKFKKEDVLDSFVKNIFNKNFVKMSIKPKIEKPSKAISNKENKRRPKTKEKFLKLEKFLNEEGIKSFLIKENDVPFVHLRFLINHGAKEEKEDFYGITNLMAKLFEEGAKGNSNEDISKMIKKIGGSYDYEVNYDSYSISLAIPSKFQNEGEKILNMLLFEPDFPQREIDRVKELLKIKIEKELKDPSFVASFVSRALLFGKNSPYGHPLFGTFNTLNNISRNDLLDYHQNSIKKKDNISLLIAGDFKKRFKVLNISTEFLTKSHKGKDLINDKPKIYFLRMKGLTSTLIMAFTLTIERTDERFEALSLLNRIIGGQFTSRLNLKMREEKGYTYHVSSFFEIRKGGLPWFIETMVAKSSTNEAINDLIEELIKLKNENEIDDKEFLETKQGILMGFLLNFETIEQRLKALERLVSFNLPFDFYETTYNNFKKLALKDVIKVKNEIFSPFNFDFLIIGDLNKNEISNPHIKEIIEIELSDFL